MDYVTRQFVALSKKLRDEFRKIREDLHSDLSRLVDSIKNLKDAIGAQRQPDEKRGNAPPVAVTDFRTNVPIPVENKTKKSVPEWVWVVFKGTIEVMGICAVIAYTYVSYHMWGEMQRTTALQEKVALVNNGEPCVETTGDIGFHHDDRSRRIWGVESVWNKGRTWADQVRIAGSMDILDSPPPKKDRKFGESDFQGITPRLEAYAVRNTTPVIPDGIYEMRRQLSEQEYTEYKTNERVALYIWGTIQYHNFLGERYTYDFCRSFPAKEVLGPATENDGAWKDKNKHQKSCEIATASSCPVTNP